MKEWQNWNLWKGHFSPSTQRNNSRTWEKSGHHSHLDESCSPGCICHYDYKTTAGLSILKWKSFYLMIMNELERETFTKNQKTYIENALLAQIFQRQDKRWKGRSVFYEGWPSWIQVNTGKILQNGHWSCAWGKSHKELAELWLEK